MAGNISVAALERTLFAEKEELLSIVLEKKRIEESLSSAGGRLEALLEMSEDLASMIEDIGEVAGKKEKMEHAAFGTKVKFSRKVRRKAKDLRNFEEEIVRRFDSGEITVKQGRKMAEIVKLMKSGNAKRAREEAGEFYGILEMHSRLGEIDGRIADASMRLARAKRGIESRRADLEWLEGQPEADEGKIARCIERDKLKASIAERRLEAIRALLRMPSPALFSHARKYGLYSAGFPEISEQEEQGLCGFLEKSNWQGKTVLQLSELAEWPEEKLRHLGVDTALFRQQIASRRQFFSQLANLRAVFATEEQGKAREYLSAVSEGAKKEFGRLDELGATKEEDCKELERHNQIESKKAEVAGKSKKELLESLQELSALEAVLEGKGQIEEGKKQAGRNEKKEEGGLMGVIRGFFR